MTKNSWENIVGISYWEIFPSVKLKWSHVIALYDVK